jgi:hypothetical protein
MDICDDAHVFGFAPYLQGVGRHAVMSVIFDRKKFRKRFLLLGTVAASVARRAQVEDITSERSQARYYVILLAWMLKNLRRREIVRFFLEFCNETIPDMLDVLKLPPSFDSQLLR